MDIQVSSIATLGQSDKWLKGTFFDTLSTTPNPSNKKKASSPKFSIIFPVPDEIRRSLNGYASGGSIHMKLQSAAQQKQLQYLKPHFCRWAGDDGGSANAVKKRGIGQPETIQKTREAGRRRAAPHIKTYIRFADSDMTRIDWAMVTSANLSTQAWGAALNGNGEVRICSWEIGVVVWPDLYSENSGSNDVEMVPSFQSDVPEMAEPGTGSMSASKIHSRVGFRMPYDLPLTPYGADDVPWCATAAHREPDWMGQTWEEG
jgi:tyrosyl-DNA phosphodiesterase-1